MGGADAEPSRSISPDPDATGGRGDRGRLLADVRRFLGVFRSVGGGSGRGSRG